MTVELNMVMRTIYIAYFSFLYVMLGGAVSSLAGLAFVAMLILAVSILTQFGVLHPYIKKNSDVVPLCALFLLAWMFASTAGYVIAAYMLYQHIDVQLYASMEGYGYTRILWSVLYIFAASAFVAVSGARRTLQKLVAHR